MEDDMEQENKVAIEETCINLKQASGEEADDVNLCCTLENNLTENGGIKSESFKVEEEDKNANHLRCSKCNGNYEGYCVKCSTLTHVLNNIIPFPNDISKLNSIPINILEIRNTSAGNGVFLLKTVPKNTTFGPFEGITVIKSEKSYKWKIKDKKLLNVHNGNWLADVVCAMNASFRNLDIVQLEGNLYFETNKQIMEGEELSVYYDDEEIQTCDSENYFIPEKKEKLSKIFACTLCCLGFGSVNCLIEHKNKCPCEEYDRNIKDLELIECPSCKITMEKQEHQEYHLDYCWAKYYGICNYTKPVKNKIMNENHSDSIEILDDELDGNNFDSSELFQDLTKKRDTKDHPSMCSDTYDQRVDSQFYIKEKHANFGNATKNKNRQSNIQYQCDVCMRKFTLKINLTKHKKSKHAKIGVEEDHKCSSYSFQTNLQEPMNVHNDIKPFQCDICMVKFTRKYNLKNHMKKKHTKNEITEKNECPESIFETHGESTLQCHLLYSDSKPFQCDICVKKFTLKSTLKMHIKNKH